MTVVQAISAVRSAGSIEAIAGKLTIRIAPARKPELEVALDTLRSNRDQALAIVEQGSTLKGHGVELWSDAMGRLFIVADDEDAELVAMRCHAKRGELWTSKEVTLIARIEDPEARLEIAHFKRTFSGKLASSLRTD